MIKNQKHRPYELEEYNPNWKQLFGETRLKLLPLFGENAIAIEHIGSTSIPGMVAKPNIDVLVVVKDLDAVTAQYDTFRAAGYTPQGREYVGDGDEYFTEDTADGRRVTSIHTLQIGHVKIRQYREFREYLTNNKDDRDLYIATKRRLYSEHNDNYPAYDSGKSETIEAIKARAKKWAETNLSEQNILL